MINRLSRRIRNTIEHYVPTTVIKQISFGVALLACLLLGSVLIFSLIAELLIKTLHFKVFEVNLISSFTTNGMYLCLPVLGYFSDVYGNNFLSLLSVFAFVPAYILNYFTVSSFQNKLPWFCFNYCLIGLGTSALYFSSLLTCSKIYPEKKGLSISLPVTCYGLSSLISTQILKLHFFDLPDSDQLDILKVFAFFAVLYLVLGLLSFVSTSIITERSFKLTETTELIPISSIEPPSHRKKFIKFLKDPIMYALLISLFLILGPLETFQNNLNSLLDLVDYPSGLSNQITLLSVFSTATRLIVGIVSDYVNKRDILIGLLLISTINQFLSVTNFNATTVSLVTILNGISYGGVFTIYPTILAEIWGVEMLGSTWGLFMVSPAISTSMFSLIYGKLVDKFGNIISYSRICFGSVFISLIFIIAIRNSKPIA